MEAATLDVVVSVETVVQRQRLVKKIQNVAVGFIPADVTGRTGPEAPHGQEPDFARFLTVGKA